MPAFAKPLFALERGLGHFEDWAGIAAVLGLAVVVNLQIFARYFFHAPFIWPEEVARLLLVWMTFIGTAAMSRRGMDLAVDTFVEMLPRIPRRAALVLRDSVMIVLFLILAFQASNLARAVGSMPLVATGFSTALLAWPLVLGGLLTAFHCLLRLIRIAIDPSSADQQVMPKTVT